MVVVAFAIDPFSLRQVLLFLLSLAHLEHLFNKQGLKGSSPDKPAYLHGLKPRKLAAGSSLSNGKSYSTINTFHAPLLPRAASNIFSSRTDLLIVGRKCYGRKVYEDLQGGQKR